MDKSTERRAAVRRRKELSRERLKIIRYLLAALALLLSVNIFFEISDIQVEGNVIYSSSEIKEASGLRTGTSGLLPVGPFVSRRIRNAAAMSFLGRIGYSARQGSSDSPRNRQQKNSSSERKTVFCRV